MKFVQIGDSIINLSIVGQIDFEGLYYTISFQGLRSDLRGQFKNDIEKDQFIEAVLNSEIS